MLFNFEFGKQTTLKYALLTPFEHTKPHLWDRSCPNFIWNMLFIC